MDPFDLNRRPGGRGGGADHDMATQGKQMLRSFIRQQQIFMDRMTPHLVPRWVFSGVMLLIFMARVFGYEKWFLICYGLSSYYLILFIDFVSPKLDPSFQATRDDLDPDSAPSLPTGANDEFRPFIRKLPEYKFWYRGTSATLISLFLSLFDFFDAPVFWPVLVLYFIFLLVLTLRRQLAHMYKYHYVPWNVGKRRYGNSQ